MARNLSLSRPHRPGSSGGRDGQRDHGEHEPGAGQQDDVHGPAADGEEAHPPHRQERPQKCGGDQREADDDQPAAPVAEGHQQQPDTHGDQHRQQRQLPDQAGQERTADVERRARHGQADSASSAAACSAARTTFCSSIARVIGPTPPGLGATKPATSTTSRATSPAILPSTRLPPTSSTAAPGFTMSALISPGTPAAATTMSAVRTCAARSRVPVWQSVTVAFSVRRVSSSPSGRPTVIPRPTITTSAPAIGTSYRRSSSTIPTGVQGSAPGTPRTSRPRFTGCRPSASLAGSMRSRTTLSSTPAGSGNWTM